MNTHLNESKNFNIVRIDSHTISHLRNVQRISLIAVCYKLFVACTSDVLHLPLYKLPRSRIRSIQSESLALGHVFRHTSLASLWQASLSVQGHKSLFASHWRVSLQA